MVEHLTITEIGRQLAKFPINGKRTEELFVQEPALEEAFIVFAKRYVDDFDKHLGIELKQSAKEKLRDLFCWALTVGYLTKDNLIKEHIERVMRK